MWKLVTFLGVTCLSRLATALPADPDDDDFECQSSLWSYDAASSSVRSASSYQTVLSTGTRTTMVTNSDVPLTTLCDGRPRALESYQVTPTTEVFTSVTPRTVWTWPSYTGASPTCVIAETACTALLTSWSSLWTEYYQNTASVSSPELPSCRTSYKTPTTTPAPTPTKDTACSRWPERCMIEPKWGAIQTVYYWPVTTVSGDFCLQNGSTITPAPTIPNTPNTAVRDGHTFTSPTNYLSLASARAVIWSDYKRVDHCGASGTLPAHTNILLPITAPLSTRTAAAYDDSAFTALDFAHFNQPLPAQAYDSFRCLLNYGSVCGPEEPIYNEGEHRPIMSVPDEVLDLEPEWREVGCTYVARQRWTQWRFTAVPLQTPPPRPF